MAGTEEHLEALSDGADEGDFAEEHAEVEVDDTGRGGPEGKTEDESPEGYGGGDYS